MNERRHSLASYSRPSAASFLLSLASPLLSLASPLLLAAIAASPVVAQEGFGAPVRVLGKVLMADGSKAQGAKVHLISDLFTYRKGNEDQIRLEFECGKRGSFRGRAPGGRAYSVWAELVGEDGKHWFSPILNDVAIGKPMRLQFPKDPWTPASLRFKGLDAWKHRGPIRARVTALSTHRYEKELALDKDGVLSLPPLPGKHYYIEIEDRDGLALEFVTFYRNSKKNSPHGKSKEGDYEIPPPAKLEILVRDKKTKKPIEGAWIRYPNSSYSTPFSKRLGTRYMGNSYQRVIQTKKDGTCTLEVPWKFSKGKRDNRALIVTKEGYMNGYGRTANSGQSDCEVVDKENGPPKLIFNLSKGYVLVGRVLGRDGKPIEGLALRCPESGLSYKKNGSMSWTHLRPMLLRTDKEGRFRIIGLLPNDGVHLVAFPTPAQAKRLLPEIPKEYQDYPLLPSVSLYSKSSIPAGKDVVDTGDLGGTKSRLLAITFRAKSGRALSESVIFLSDKYFNVNSEGKSTSAYTDRKGRILLTVPRKSFSLFATDFDSNYKAETLPAAKDKDPLVQKLELLADPMQQVSGIVRDEAGNPIPDANIQSWGSRSSGSVPGYVNTLNYRFIQKKTDKNGRFSFSFISHPGYSLRIKARIRVNGKTIYSAAAVSISSDSQEDLELVIPVPKAEPVKKAEEAKGEAVAPAAQRKR